jgi:YidC/Oxa1 family membrane protein insertase
MDSSWRRVLLTVVISAGILFVWQFFFTEKPKPPPKKAPPTKTKPAEEPGSARTPGSQPSSQPSSRPSRKADPRVAEDMEGKQTTLRAPGAVARFTTTGAALRSWKLTEPRYKELLKGKLVPVDLVQTEAKKGPWPLTVTFPDSDFRVPENARFKIVSADSRQVLYSWSSEKVRIIKHFKVDPERPMVWMTLKVKNLTRRKLNQRLQLNLYNRQDPNQAKAGFTNPYPKISTVLCHVNGELERRSPGAIRGEDSGCSAAGCGMGEGPVSQTGQVRWTASDNRYFITAVVPQNSDESRRCELEVLDSDENVVAARLQFSAGVINAGDTLERRFAVFVGHKQLAALDTVKGAENEEAELSDSIEFGWFAVLCRPMLWLLKLFYSWVGNWGIAIILLTVVVKLLTLYWTQKSMRSMKAMQKLKPKMDELREKFKDDKERLNQEMMALYKIHKVNPLGGCLPMIIQMPVWFALYRTLGNAVELYRSDFVGWITDLTAPDPFYILPIAMGASMYAQQAITPQPMEGTQAKIFKYVMPGMFTVMMLALPSGLTLYIFVNTLLTMIHQWYMNKTDPDKGKGKPAPDGAAKAPSQSPGKKKDPDGRPKVRRRKKRKR